MELASNKKGFTGKSKVISVIDLNGLDLFLPINDRWGAVAQWIERTTPGEDVPGSIPAPYWLGPCQYNVTS